MSINESRHFDVWFKTSRGQHITVVTVYTTRLDAKRRALACLAGRLKKAAKAGVCSTVLSE